MSPLTIPFKIATLPSGYQSGEIGLSGNDMNVSEAENFMRKLGTDPTSTSRLFLPTSAAGSDTSIAERKGWRVEITPSQP